MNPLIIPPDSLQLVLAQAEEDMKRNPQLTLPEDPNINIWNYYSIMKVTPIIMENFLMVILTIPLADQSLVMNLYKIHNLPALHPRLHVQFQCQLEGEYLAITKDKQYAALPTAQDIRICETTERYLCLMTQALYKIEWCVFTLQVGHRRNGDLLYCDHYIWTCWYGTELRWISMGSWLSQGGGG